MEQQGRGIENAAREARYAALREEAERLGIARIAVAHHQRDQAETVLLHLMRGSALAGLCAMEPVRADGIIRPLLFESREQIEQYCEQNGLSFVTDSTNAELLYTRNAVRLELLPMMERTVRDRFRRLFPVRSCFGGIMRRLRSLPARCMQMQSPRAAGLCE